MTAFADPFVEFLPRAFGFGAGSVLGGITGAIGLGLWPNELGDGTLSPEARAYQFPVYPDVPSAEPAQQWLQRSLMTYPRDEPVPGFATLGASVTVVRPGVLELPHPDDLPSEVGLPAPVVGLPPTVATPGIAQVGVRPWPWDLPVEADLPTVMSPARPVLHPPPLLPTLSLRVVANRGVTQVHIVPRQPVKAPPERPRRQERKSYDRRAQWVMRRMYQAFRGFGRITELQDFLEAVVWNAYSATRVTKDGRPVMAMAAVRQDAWRGVRGTDAWMGAQVNARSYAYVLQGIASGEFYVDLPGAVSSILANEVVDRASGRLSRAQGAGLDRLVGDRRKFGLARDVFGPTF